MEFTQEYKDYVREARINHNNKIKRADASLSQLRFRARAQNGLFGVIDYLTPELLIKSLFKVNKGYRKLSPKFVIKVLEDPERYFEDKINQIRRGEYYPGVLKQVEIVIERKGKEPKKRTVAPCRNFDKVLQKAIALILEALYGYRFYRNSHAYQKGKGVHTCRKDLEEHLYSSGNHWILKADIQQFFPSISHKRLLAILKKKIKDRRFLKLIKLMLKSKVINLNKELRKTKLGVIQGSVIGPILSNIFLHFFFDTWCLKKLAKFGAQAFYDRYADDILLSFASYKDALEFRDLVKTRLEKIGLKLNTKKHKSLIVNLTKKSILFLGKPISIINKEVIMT